MKKKILLSIIAVILVLGGALLAYKLYLLRTEAEQVFCTMEARQCPDGSYVGRVPPKCDFAQCPDETASWNVYGNLGVSFKYPAEWLSPDESIYETYAHVNFAVGESNQPFSLSIQPMTAPFDSMVSQFYNSNVNVDSVSDISAGGLKGKEVVIKSVTSGRAYFLNAYFPINDKEYITFSSDINATSKDIFDKVISTFKPDAATAIKKSASGQRIYENNGISLQYPSGFGTKYASLNLHVLVEKTDTKEISCNREKGVEVAEIKNINGVKFCYEEYSDVGAGQLYTTYSYKTLKDGKYFLIKYVVHTANGCSAYMGTESYAPCIDFENKYDSTVLKFIQESIATFKFTK